MNLLTNSIIKRKGAQEAGLIGGFYSFTPGAEVIGLSCNHVIADYNNCSPGDILTDENEKTVGTLINWLILDEDLVNGAEFALFRLDEKYKPAWTTNGIPAQPTFAIPELNSLVQFPLVDGTISLGQISELDHHVRIKHGNEVYNFGGCIQVTSPDGAIFSKAGHSGGVVFSNNEVLGIILGTSKDGRKTYVVPFEGGILKFVELVVSG